MEPSGREDVVDLIMHDHREVQDLFRQVQAVPFADPRRRTLADQIIVELVRHSVAEEMYVYPAMRAHLAGGDALADHEIAEHARAEEILAQLEGLEPAHPKFDELMAQLIAEINHHIAEEENESLPALRSAVSNDTMVSLGEKFRSAKKRAPTRPHPKAPDTPPGDKIVGPPLGLIDRVRDAMSRKR